MIRKWFFTLSESSIERAGHGWRGLIRVAVKSAMLHTSLQPHLIYDGKENEFIAELRELGVKVINHRVSFYDSLLEREEKQPGYLSICSAVFLRVEIPLLEQEDDFVFFSDCDVMFMSPPDFNNITPSTFASAPQFSKTDYRHDINTGVMVMNLASMRDELPSFKDFILRNLHNGWPGCDQENYRRYYQGKWQKLPLSLNWKPYWGVNDTAQLVHWHGPKPRTVRDLLSGRRDGINSDFIKLFSLNEESYEYYYRHWMKLAEGNRPTIFGHIDQIAQGVISGWALNDDMVDVPVAMKVVIDGKHVGQIECKHSRQDLSNIYGVKVGSFDFNIPRELCDGVRHELTFLDATNQRVALKIAGVTRDMNEFMWSEGSSP